MEDKDKKDKVEKLPAIRVSDDKIDIARTVKAQVALLSLETPQKFIKRRKGRGGMSFDYVETNYVLARLNATFMFDWDNEIIEQIIDKDENQIATKVRLIVRFADGKVVKKDAWGGAEIKRLKESKKIMDLANDLKASESDAIKKAASMLGVCWDVYSGMTKNGKSQKKESKKGVDDYPQSDRQDEFRTIPLVVEGTELMVTKFEALDYFKKAKVALGDNQYYEILGTFGCEKSNELTPKDIPKAYAEMIMIYKEQL